MNTQNFIDDTMRDINRRRLEKAAPDLLEACKAILSRYESLFSGVETCDIHPTDEAVMNEVRAAIAKAEGSK